MSKFSREVLESLSLGVFKRCLEGTLGEWFRDDYGGAGLMVALDDLEGLIQPWWLCDSMIIDTEVEEACFPKKYMNLGKEELLVGGGYNYWSRLG